MLLPLVSGLIMGALAVIFALQNVFPVTVVFLDWQITASLALIIVIAMFMGIVITILFSIPSMVRNSMSIFKLNKENKELSDELEMIRRSNYNAGVHVPPPAPAPAPTLADLL